MWERSESSKPRKLTYDFAVDGFRSAILPRRTANSQMVEPAFSRWLSLRKSPVGCEPARFGTKHGNELRPPIKSLGRPLTARSKSECKNGHQVAEDTAKLNHDGEPLRES
jgi:hypothetical protein